MIITYGIQKTNHSYFSITAEIGELRQKTKKGLNEFIKDEQGNKYHVIMGGRCHAEILKQCKDFSDIVSLHLSNTEGVPMHAMENGYYFYELGEYENVMELLRIDNETLNVLHHRLKTSKYLKKYIFFEFCAEQYKRWNNEARAVIEKYDLSVE